MANFNTHIFISATASSIAAVSASHIGLIKLLDIPWFIFLGTAGGLLPDIDSNSSQSLKLLFNSLALLISVLTILAYKGQYILPHLFIIASSTFLVVRFPIMEIFKRFTVHRGAIHSLLCASFFTLLTVYIFYNLFDNSIPFSWLSGLFIGFGFIVHLLLDEFYSVDLSNAQLKRSFGTAFKLFSIKYLGVSLVILASSITLYFYTPGYPFSLNWLYK